MATRRSSPAALTAEPETTSGISTRTNAAQTAGVASTPVSGLWTHIRLMRPTARSGMPQIGATLLVAVATAAWTAAAGSAAKVSGLGVVGREAAIARNGMWFDLRDQGAGPLADR